MSCDFEGGSSNAGTPASHPSPCPLPHRPGITTPSVSTPSSSDSGFAVAALPLYQTPSDFLRADINPASSRLLELRLMHHFTAQTSQTFSDINEARNAWQVDIPTIAYGAQHLMDAILAVSALHLRALHPDDQTLVRASHGYMASALAQYSSLLTQGLSELNAEALFSTSALIAFQASASRRFEDLDRGYSLPLAWFHSFQGVKTVVMASWQWLRKSDRVSPIINSQHALALNLDPQRRLFFSPILEGLDAQLGSLPENLVAETRQAYEHAVAFLNWAHQSPIRNRILGFAATVSRRFVDLMAQKDPRALVIVACFFALTKIVDDVWWLQGVAKREVNGIFSLLPQEWLPKMEWPLKIANHEGVIDGELWGEPLHTFKMEQDLSYDNVVNHIELLTRVLESYTPPQLPPD